jgi:hypothetical protein
MVDQWTSHFACQDIGVAIGRSPERLFSCLSGEGTLPHDLANAMMSAFTTSFAEVVSISQAARQAAFSSLSHHSVVPAVSRWDVRWPRSSKEEAHVSPVH